MHSYTTDGERILSVHIVAIRLGVSDRTVRLWAARGWLPAFKDGPKIWRFRATDVEAARARLAPRRRRAADASGDSRVIQSDNPLLHFRFRHLRDEVELVIGRSAVRVILALITLALALASALR